MSHTLLSTTQSVIDALRYEFDQLEIQIESINIERGMGPICTGNRGRPGPSFALNGYDNLSVHFTCSQDKFKCIEPLVQSVTMRAITTPPPIRLFKLNESPEAFASMIEHFYDCTMVLRLTGGDMSQFINLFREQTSDLRYKIESSKFDKEVEKMLTDDGYNN